MQSNLSNLMAFEFILCFEISSPLIVYIFTRSLVPKSFTRSSLDVLFKISQGIFWQSFFIHYCCQSLQRELENFDIKTIFARKENIFCWFVYISAQHVQPSLGDGLQQQTLNKKAKVLLKYAIIIVGRRNERQIFWKY